HPWWQAFERLGDRLVRAGAVVQGRLTVQELLGRLNVFPLSRDALPGQSADRARIAELTADFRLLGLDGLQQAKPSNLAALSSAHGTGSDLTAAMLHSRSLQYELLPKTGKLLSALSAEHSSFVLESVDGALQQELSQKMSSPLPLALLRYRYLRVSADSLPFKGGQLTESAGAKPALLFEDAVYSQGLRFDFYRWSQDSEPAVSLQLSGGYPALQLYLSSEAVFDVRSKSCYVPLILNDSQGQGSSVYFVRLKLSEDFPEPDKWPRSADFEAGSAELSQSIFAQPGY
ncbi:MAG: hypothetical protein IAB19_06105, partial [Proteobacteria bacterium]|nr:hypothetical protein [Candidatus Avisuccinivibrio stercorigallinarum]